MVDFSKEEIIKIAKHSGLKLNKEEIDHLQEQLKKTLAYTEELNQFKTTIEHEAIKSINVFREDKAIQTDSSAILKQAPKTKETYYVVPKILD